MSKKPNILLVHGAWADGFCWRKVIPLLNAAGYNVVVMQQNLVSLEEDAETVRRSTEALEGPVLLVGHSYGGAIITEAAHICPNVIGLVYLAAFALDKGESLAILSASGPVAPPGAAAIRPDTNFLFSFHSQQNQLHGRSMPYKLVKDSDRRWRPYRRHRLQIHS
jgi:pimeloyl-ACP methyl ester carboxylesterase